MQKYLQATKTIESEHPAIIQFSQEHIGSAVSDTDKAINLYLAVRDEIRYDPYHISFSVDGLKASTVLNEKRGWCISKAALLAACCRSVNIPARLGFADVCNHLSTQRMRETMNSNVFYWHGYTSIFLNEKWVKATPAFNKELCEKLNIATLGFDGKTDSLYQEYDQAGNKHMEYLRERGDYADLPLAEIVVDMKKYYGADIDKMLNSHDFEKDIISD